MNECALDEDFQKEVWSSLGRFSRKLRNNHAQSHVLVFPPLNSKGRYLIHQCAGRLSGLKSLSVGEGDCRQVVCMADVTRCKMKKKPDMQLYTPKRKIIPIRQSQSITKMPSLKRNEDNFLSETTPDSVNCSEASELSSQLSGLMSSTQEENSYGLSCEALSSELCSTNVVESSVKVKGLPFQGIALDEESAILDINKTRVADEGLCAGHIDPYPLDKAGDANSEILQESRIKERVALTSEYSAHDVSKHKLDLNVICDKASLQGDLHPGKEKLIMEYVAFPLLNEALCAVFNILRDLPYHVNDSRTEDATSMVLSHKLHSFATNLVETAIGNALCLLRVQRTLDTKDLARSCESANIVESLICAALPEVSAMEVGPVRPVLDVDRDPKPLGSPPTKTIKKRLRHGKKSTRKVLSSMQMSGMQLIKAKAVELESSESVPKSILSSAPCDLEHQKLQESITQDASGCLDSDASAKLISLSITDALKNSEEDVPDWEKHWSESGECLSNDQLLELSRLTGISNPILEVPYGIDYWSYKPVKDVDLDEGAYGHILELFDFSHVLKTQDLSNALNSLGASDYSLTWVDDTHCLAVFSSQSAAHAAAKQYSPIMQMRQIVNGSIQSKKKARENQEVLLPYKKRPATTALVARNLVTGALGLRSNLSPDQRRKERLELHDAREKKRETARRKEQIWNGPV